MPDNSSYVALRFSSEFRQALSLLLDGARFAEDAGRPSWDFAVTVGDLYAMGMTTNAIKWLICKGYATHRAERISVHKQQRCKSLASPKFAVSKSSELILTEPGIAFVSHLHAAQPLTPAATDTRSPLIKSPGWDINSRILRVGTTVVKHFKVPAGNQELILSAFEEEHWPARIDDPLPPRPALDAKRRLHDTINRLNRNQQTRLVRFKGNGNGRAVCWEYVAQQ